MAAKSVKTPAAKPKMVVPEVPKAAQKPDWLPELPNVAEIRKVAEPEAPRAVVPVAVIPVPAPEALTGVMLRYIGKLEHDAPFYADGKLFTVHIGSPPFFATFKQAAKLLKSSQFEVVK
jgi:hypothetical protein